MLKNLICAVLFLTCLSALSAQRKDEYYLSDVDDNYIGTYIPTYFEAYMTKKKSFYDAFSLDSPEHDVLYLRKNICYSDKGFHDGYAVTAEEFKDFLFVTNEKDTYCIGKDGGSYHRISKPKNPQEYEYGYEEYAEYVTSTLLSFAKDMKNVQINGDSLTLDGVTYSVNLDRNFFSTENVALWLHSKQTGWCALVKNGVNGELHQGYESENHFEVIPKDEVIKEFPMMFFRTDEEYPRYWNLPKEQYRYLRNYVYARHGYIFKSEDLQNFFRQFTWYHQNPDFKESEFNWEEKSFIEYILRAENKK